MQSWHDLGLDRSYKVVGTGGGSLRLERKPRLDVLRKEPSDYLFFRVVWAETRTRLSDLKPRASRPSAGVPVIKAGVLSWRSRPTRRIRVKNVGIRRPPHPVMLGMSHERPPAAGDVGVADVVHHHAVRR